MNATGVWKGIGFWDHPVTCAGIKGEVFVSDKDRCVLRRLAEKVAYLSSRPGESEKRRLWYSHNALDTRQPVILADPENGWNEIITENQLECEGDLARRWEVVLRKEIFWGESIEDDRPIEPCIYIGYTYRDSGWGLSAAVRGGKNGGSYAWDSPVKKLKDLKKLHYPEIAVDHATTEESVQCAKEVFGDLLEVKVRGVWWWGFGLGYDLVMLLGMERIMLLPYDDPELLRLTMEILRDGNQNRLDFLEENGLLSLNNDSSYIGSGGLGFSRELPKRNMAGQNVQTADMWGFADSQESCGMSPAMYEEFFFQYQLPLLQRFGLNCYGCCEPLERRWHIIRAIPNLRRVSVSAWADKGKMAEFLEDRYIYSLKPNPADLAVAVMDLDKVRKETRKNLETTRGCIVEIIMKDNHTLGKNPSNIVNWVKIVRNEVDRMHGN